MLMKREERERKAFISIRAVGWNRSGSRVVLVGVVEVPGGISRRIGTRPPSLSTSLSLSLSLANGSPLANPLQYFSQVERLKSIPVCLVELVVELHPVESQGVEKRGQ